MTSKFFVSKRTSSSIHHILYPAERWHYIRQISHHNVGCLRFTADNVSDSSMEIAALVFVHGKKLISGLLLCRVNTAKRNGRLR